MPSSVPSRDAVIEELHRNNVLARKYFWPGCHRMEPYVRRLDETLPNLPATEEVAARVVVLPTGTAVTPEDCRLITEIVADVGA